MIEPDAAERRRQQNRAAGQRYRQTAKAKATRAAALAKVKGKCPDDQHGTENGYRRYGCHCERCKAAHADYNRKYPNTPPSVATREHRSAQRRALHNAERRRRALRQYHGMTLEDWDAMWAAQDGRCYLCDDPFGQDGTGLRPAIEHDHSCCPRGRSCVRCRRGLSCHPCNASIGYARDDPDRLRKLADRLQAAQRRIESERVA